VIAGQGGCGKSRIVLQAIASIVSGKKFLHFETRGKTLKWLLLQTENSNRRLQKDLLWLKLWMGGDSWGRFCEQVRIHTIETDRDGLVSLDSPQNQAAIRTAIESDKFDGIVIDPLSHFMIGDPNKDFEMMMFLQVLSRICRHGNPNRALIVVHHAIVGRGGAVKATGYDRGSFGRGSKALFGWARAQINLAPVDAHSNDRLVVACGKNSNGREFQPFAIRLNPDTMIYECDPSVDVAGWARDMSGAAERGPAMDATRVAELCKPATPRQELAKLIMADCGCSKATAYRQIRQANGKTIRCDKNDVFSPASHENLMRQDAESLTSHTPCKGVRRDAQPRETDDQTNRSLECREVEV
jgi:hypothetical protein